MAALWCHGHPVHLSIGSQNALSLTTTDHDPYYYHRPSKNTQLCSNFLSHDEARLLS